MPYFPKSLWVNLEMWLRDKHRLAYYMADFNRDLQAYYERRLHSGRWLWAVIILCTAILATWAVRR